MEDNFSPQQSLELIRSMIDKTKANLSENRIYFLLWGWISFMAIIGQFVLKVLVHYPHHYLVWLITIPASVWTMIYTARHRNDKTVKTYIGESMSYLWTGIGISFFILSVIITRTTGGWMNAWPFFILFYGLGTFISGKFLKFNPLIIGGVISWILAVVSVYVSFDYQLLLAAGAILISYIIPGHLLSKAS
ncbi:MAG TPA: hypothetical protein VHK91_07945 [Flavisolibacter sp.]|jgi:hypothetical protein|nr:hypothetical protein [Flavisolibacter sp.]